MKRKIAVILQKHSSGWLSCRKITRNLVKSYERAFAGKNFQIRLFQFEPDASAFESYAEADRLFGFKPDLISFVDHFPHPGPILQMLSSRYTTDFFPRVAIHVFGDFMLHPGRWIASSDALRRGRALFICASEKQRNLISSLIEGMGEAAIAIPFPLDRSEFHYSDLKTEKTGKSPAEDCTFLYSGRLSMQKNIVLLLKAFGAYCSQINPSAKLWLAGPVDDIGAPYLGVLQPPGQFSAELLNLIENILPPAAAKQVRYQGNLGTEELRSLCHRADFFVSFSTHNDEDFGMAPAEAMACGLPLLLSDWGGYSSFRKIKPEAVLTVPVQIGKRSVEPDVFLCVKSFAKAVSMRDRLPDRAEISSAALAQLSIETVAERLESGLFAENENGFTGFNDRFLRIHNAFSVTSKMPFSRNNEFSDLYREVYGTYL